MDSCCECSILSPYPRPAASANETPFFPSLYIARRGTLNSVQPLPKIIIPDPEILIRGHICTAC